MSLPRAALAVLEQAESTVDGSVSHNDNLRRSLPSTLRSDATMRALGAVAAAAVRAELLKRIREIDQ